MSDAQFCVCPAWQVTWQVVLKDARLKPPSPPPVAADASALAATPAQHTFPEGQSVVDWHSFDTPPLHWPLATHAAVTEKLVIESVVQHDWPAGHVPASPPPVADASWPHVALIPMLVPPLSETGENGAASPLVPESPGEPAFPDEELQAAASANGRRAEGPIHKAARRRALRGVRMTICALWAAGRKRDHAASFVAVPKPGGSPVRDTWEAL